MKLGGGIAGHNGLQDIARAARHPDFWRLRIGIGHPRDSAIPQQDVADYVLTPPRADERRSIDDRDRPRARRVAGDRGRRHASARCMLLHTEANKDSP